MENNDVCFDRSSVWPMIELDDILGIQWQLLQQHVYDVFLKVLMIKQTVQQDKKDVTLLIKYIWKYFKHWQNLICIFTTQELNKTK